MFKFIRRTVIAFALLAGFGYLAFGSSAGSYAKGALSQLQREARDMVPLELELERAEVALREADEQIAEHRRLHAESAVIVEDLERKIEALERSRDQGLVQLRMLHAAYEATDRGAEPVAVFRGRRVEAKTIRRELHSTVVHTEAVEQQLEMKKQLLETRRSHLEDLEHALLTAEAERERLLIQLETRRVELECVQLAGLPADPSSPPTGLAEAEAALTRVDREVRVLKRLTGLRPPDADGKWLRRETTAASVADRADRLLRRAEQLPAEESADAFMKR